jgi:hypothetical protein
MGSYPVGCRVIGYQSLAAVSALTSVAAQLPSSGTHRLLSPKKKAPHL